MKPYDPYSCCGTDCIRCIEGSTDCEGDVEVVEELMYDTEDGWSDSVWVHACEKHLKEVTIQYLGWY